MSINTSLIMMILIVLLLSSVCICGCERSTNGDSFWFTGPSGTFHTNDVRRAQEQIPFPIILPTYVPCDLESYPELEGPVKGSCPDDRIKITARYKTKGTSYYLLSITEERGTIIVHSAPDANVTKMNIAGTQIMEEEFEQRVICPSGLNHHQALSYTWNESNMHFEVVISEYDRTEAIKVIKSMMPR